MSSCASEGTGLIARIVRPFLDAQLSTLLIVTFLALGVEHVYSLARRGRAIVTVRFEVGENREMALTRLHEQIGMHEDRVPAIVDRWMVKPVGVEDVLVLALTLHSDQHSDAELQRFAEEMLARLAPQENLSKTTIIGGRRREIRVELDPARMVSRGVTPLMVAEL